MSKKQGCLVLLVMFISLLICNKCFAQENNNIQFIDNQKSIKNLVTIQSNKTMLIKTWYTYKFEVNLNKKTEYGKIYPINQTEYQKALKQVDFPMDNIKDYEVYFLDYKLKNYPSNLALSFMDGDTIVFGSYYQLSEEKINQIATHELGHQIDFKLMNKKTWQKYIKLRGLTNTKIYNNKSLIHENRPQEIFAEDFRLLFESKKAKTITHLNQNLPDPDSVPGLKEFFLSLS